MEYADMVWDGCIKSEGDVLKRVQYKAAKIVIGANKGTGKHRLVLELGWEEMRLKWAVHKVMLYYKIVNNPCTNYMLPLSILFLCNSYPFLLSYSYNKMHIYLKYCKHPRWVFATLGANFN